MEILLLVFLGLTAFFFVARNQGRKDSNKVHSAVAPDLHRTHKHAINSDTTPTTGAPERPVLGFIQTLAQAAGLAAASMAAIAVGTVVLGTVVAAHLIRSGLAEYGKARSSADPLRDRNRRESEIRDINSEIGDYENKRFKDGLLNEYDAHRLDELYGRRDERALQLAETNGIILANQMSAGVGIYDNVRVSDVNTHILQFHVGQTVFGKTCYRCGMPMALQWQQRLDTVRMTDFFWGCTGFYDATCRSTEPFSRSDMTLFTNTDREEFTISNSELASIVRLPESRQLIRRRMNDLVSTANSTYYCPIHHEPMVLKTKKDAETIRDMYFYGCPRWHPSGQSCNQIVKLKSVAQVSAALETMTGKGFL